MPNLNITCSKKTVLCFSKQQSQNPEQPLQCVAGSCHLQLCLKHKLTLGQFVLNSNAAFHEVFSSASAIVRQISFCAYHYK